MNINTDTANNSEKVSLNEKPVSTITTFNSANSSTTENVMYYRISKGTITLQNGLVMKKCEMCHRHRSSVEMCRLSKHHTQPDWDDIDRKNIISVPYVTFKRVDNGDDIVPRIVTNTASILQSRPSTRKSSDRIIKLKPTELAPKLQQVISQYPEVDAYSLYDADDYASEFHRSEIQYTRFENLIHDMESQNKEKSSQLSDLLQQIKLRIHDARAQKKLFWNVALSSEVL
jgi:hypothetical protein